MSIEEDYKKTLKELYESVPSETQQWIDNEVSKIQKIFWLWLIFLVFSLSGVFALVFMNPLGEQVGIWIQRSGSLISLLAVIAEVGFISKLSKLVNISHWATLTCEVYLERKYKRLLNLTIVVTISLASFGTILWGYGDLLYGLL